MMLVCDGFELVSLADPTVPVSLSTMPSSGTYVRSAMLRGGLAYLGDADGVQVWNVSSPISPAAGTRVAAPTLEHTFDLPVGTDSYYVAELDGGPLQHWS